MTILIAGLILWSAVHFWKRLAPASRAKAGGGGRWIVTVGALAGIMLMVIGYRGAEGAVFWGRSAAMTGINNLLMLFAIYLYAASGAKTRITRVIRHPQLTAVKVWALAHLLVNGDTPSFVLFGGLLAWAVVEVILINRANRQWTPPAPAPLKKEVTAIIATIVVYAVVSGIHAWLGYNPFG
jgi:uncharacterized membrane protein